MKKALLFTAVLVLALSSAMAAGGRIGATVGPAFDIYSQKATIEGESASVRSDMMTDFGMDIAIEGAYYFDQNTTLGVGASLGTGIYFGNTTREGQSFDNLTAGTEITASVTFQYRLPLTEALDLRFGAGLGYAHTFLDVEKK